MNQFAGDSILVVRIGAFGDILHALPAVASLRASFPVSTISWLVAPRWMPLLAGNPAIDFLVPFERGTFDQIRRTAAQLRPLQPAAAFDFQGLLQSAIAGRLARPKVFWGFDRAIAREPLASFLYHRKVHAGALHRVERNLGLVAAAGATNRITKTFIPAGTPDGQLPPGPFVLASPFAGWPGKEWPLAFYSQLGKDLAGQGIALVLNVTAAKAKDLLTLPHVHVHTSSIAGLIDATRRAVAVLGVDSGPLHLAAALDKPGVAIYGPTDPAQTGPFGGTISVLRAPDAVSTYKRHRQVHSSMEAITPDGVHAALLASIQTSRALAVGSRS